MTCPMQTWVGAYVLDALEPDESESLRVHIAECEECQDEVVGLSWIPPMLRSVDVESIERLGRVPDDGRPPPLMLERLLASVQPGPRIRRFRRPRVLLVAAAMAVAIGAGAAAATGAFSSSHDAPAPVAIKTVDPKSHVRAAVTMTGRGWGTELHLSLDWVAPGQHCSLVARSRDGNSDVAATWVATYQGTASVPGTTAIPFSKLAELDVVTADGRQLVRLVVPHNTK